MNANSIPDYSYRFILMLLLLSILIASNDVVAQSNDLISKARNGIAAIGKQWNGEIAVASTKLYIDIHRQVDSSGIKQISDLSYGPHKLQNFDLFVPAQGFNESGPVLIFFHGGGFIRGDKVTGGTEGLIYSNVGKLAARFGGIGINANYRLTPEAKFPSGAEDIKLLLEWVRNNVREYGGDPDNVFLMGNSAGAAQVATYLFLEDYQFDEGPGVRGAIMASGAFRADDDPARIAYYGENITVRERNMPLGLIDSYEGQAVPIFLWSAEYDPASIETSVAEMYAKLCRKYDDCPMFVQFQGHNHISHVLSIDTADTKVANAIIRFYHSVIDNR